MKAEARVPPVRKGSDAKVFERRFTTRFLQAAPAQACNESFRFGAHASAKISLLRMHVLADRLKSDFLSPVPA